MLAPNPNDPRMDILMQTARKLVTRTLWIFLGFCLCAPKVHAYLDPGSGSMLVQILLAGVAGLAVAIKVFWRRILAFFGLVKDKKRDEGKPSS
jgi:hypothetical protein